MRILVIIPVKSRDDICVEESFAAGDADGEVHGDGVGIGGEDGAIERGGVAGCRAGAEEGGEPSSKGELGTHADLVWKFGRSVDIDRVVNYAGIVAVRVGDEIRGGHVDNCGVVDSICNVLD